MTDTSSWVEPSTGSTVAFIAVLGLTLGLFVWGVSLVFENRSRAALMAALGAGAWLLITGGYVAAGGTSAGVPGLMGFFAIANLAGIVLAFSPLGTRLVEGLPLWGLAAFHGFRLPLEWILHEWGKQGTMPVQMTFDGHNFDVITGIFAVVVGAVAVLGKKAPPRWLILLFNIVGSALLAAVIGIVVASSPLPIKQYDGPPILVALFLPYAWIAPICVAGALSAHLMLWRALARGDQRKRASAH